MNTPETDKKHSYLGFLWGVLTALCFGSGVIFAKWLGVGQTPIFDTFLTQLIALIVIMVISLFQKSRRDDIQWRKLQRHFWLIFGAGVLGLGLPVMLAVLGFKQTPVVRGTIILQFQTLVALFVGWVFLKETIRTQQFLGIAFVIIGGIVAVIAPGAGVSDAASLGQGDLYLVGAALCFGISFSFIKLLSVHFEVVTISLLRLMGSVGLLGVLTLSMEVSQVQFVNGSTLWTIVGYALTNFVLGSLFLNASMVQLKSWQSASLMHMSPVFTLLFVVPIFHESLSWFQIAGIILLLLGNLWIEFKKA